MAAVFEELQNLLKINRVSLDTLGSSDTRPSIAEIEKELVILKQFAAAFIDPNSPFNRQSVTIFQPISTSEVPPEFANFAVSGSGGHWYFNEYSCDLKSILNNPANLVDTPVTMSITYLTSLGSESTRVMLSQRVKRFKRPLPPRLVILDRTVDSIATRQQQFEGSACGV
jgi:hypothetical protein